MIISSKLANFMVMSLRGPQTVDDVVFLTKITISFQKSMTQSKCVCDFSSSLTGCVMIAATQLKPDEGTPELPDGMVRVRLDTDGSLHDVTEYETEQVERPFLYLLSLLCLKPTSPLQCNPPEQNLCEDLSNLQHVNECGVLNTLSSRARADMPLTHAGPNLVSFWPPIQTHSKVRPATRPVLKN